MFTTSNMDIVSNCQFYFRFMLPSELRSNRIKSVISNMSRAAAALSVIYATLFVKKTAHK